MGFGHTSSCTLTTKSACAADEDSRLIFKEELSRGLVPGLDEGRDGSGLTLVQNFEQPMVRMVSGRAKSRADRVVTHRVSFTTLA